MGHKGGLRHLKRLPAPWFWPIHRKEHTWTPKPDPGAHKSSASLPLQLILRDGLGIARTGREVSKVLSEGKVRVDGGIRRDSNYPVGLMDVVEVPDANLTYRLLPITGRGLSLVRIPKDEAKFKLCRILAKSTVPGGKIQYGLHDGRSLMQPSTGAESSYSINDTLRIGIPAQRILNHVKFEKGNLGLVVAGRNLGRTGRIVDWQAGTATRPATVTIEDSTGTKFDTMAAYVFIVGTDKPAIKLEAA